MISIALTAATLQQPRPTITANYLRWFQFRVSSRKWRCRFRNVWNKRQVLHPRKIRVDALADFFNGDYPPIVIVLNGVEVAVIHVPLADEQIFVSFSQQPNILAVIFGCYLCKFIHYVKGLFGMPELRCKGLMLRCRLGRHLLMQRRIVLTKKCFV